MSHVTDKNSLQGKIIDALIKDQGLDSWVHFIYYILFYRDLGLEPG